MKDYRTFQKAVAFLNDHPALNMSGGDFFSANLTWWYYPECVNGESREIYQKTNDPHIRISKGDKNISDAKYDKLAQKYDPSGTEDELTVKYSEVYGCKWKYDHDMYFGELSLVKYDGDAVVTDKFSSRYPSYESFKRYQGEYARAGTFDEMIILLYKKAKKNYGDFDSYSFLTTEEVENHKYMRPFFSKPLENGCYEMIHNNDYITVYDWQLNLRWWEHYRTTSHYKKHWDGE